MEDRNSYAELKILLKIELYFLPDISQMSDNQVFDQNKVEQYVALCEEGGNLRRAGASAETLAEINIRINRALVALLPTSNDANAELLFQIINGTPPQATSAATDPTDPTDPTDSN
jgi:hypothetical protein